jgi:hypothetical protein
MGLIQYRFFRERRPVKLTSEEEEVHRLAFGDLPAREVLRVLSIGSGIMAGLADTSPKLLHSAEQRPPRNLAAWLPVSANVGYWTRTPVSHPKVHRILYAPTFSPITSPETMISTRRFF